MFTFLYNIFTRSLAVLLLASISVNFLPKQLFHDFPFEPKSMEPLKYETVKPDWNTRLSDDQSTEYVQLNNILGPESIAISPSDGLLYTGLADGRLIELNPNQKFKIRQVLRFKTLSKCKDNIASEAIDCGRFLQLRFKNSTLYGVEANTGLYKIDIKSGAKTFIGPKTKFQPINIYNSFTFDPKEPNIVYMTVSSTKWDIQTIVWGMIELDSTGQVIAMDTNTGKRVIIADNLMLSNGIDVDSKRDELIFSETGRSRLLSLCLKEVRQLFKTSKDGNNLNDKLKLTELIPLIPGLPDNVNIHGDIAYVALPFVKLNGSEVLDSMSDAPMIRKAYGRIQFSLGKLIEYFCTTLYNHPILETFYKELKSGHLNYRVVKSDKSAVLEYNLSNGSSRLLGSDKFGYLSEATPDNKGNLYLGSFRSPFIVKVKV